MSTFGRDLLLVCLGADAMVASEHARRHEWALMLVAFASCALTLIVIYRARRRTTEVPWPVECRACRIVACEVEGNTAEEHTCVAPPADSQAGR